MVINLVDVSVFAEIVDGKIELVIPLSTFDDFDNDEAFDAMQRWVEQGDDCEIITKFSINDILNTSINMHEMTAFDNLIDIEPKPMFDLMRKELVEIISKIDALKFADPDLL
jgi:hypothetical protein